MASVAVVGAGISGLTAAYRLGQKGLRVTLFEASSRTGGVIRSETTAGYLAESGPNSMRESSPLIAALVRELGLEEQRIDASAAARRRYIVRGGRLWPLPDSPAAFVTSRLFSLAAMLRVLREPFVKPGDLEHEESMADFIRRRLGGEILEYAANPFVAGIFAGNPERLSVRYAFPDLYEVEQRYGSLLKGQLQKARTRERQHVAPEHSRGALSLRMFSFRGGMQTLTDALQARLGDAVRLNSPVRELRQTASGWAVTALAGNRPVTERFDAVLYTAPLYRLPAIGLACTAGARGLADVYYPPLSIVVLGFRREDVRHPLDGFGMLVPAIEPLQILGTLFSSTMFPGRAPEGHVTLTTFIGGVRNPALALASTTTLLDAVKQDLHTLIGVTGEPTYRKHIVWEHSIPQYDLGYGRLQGIMDQMEAQHPGFFMAGNYRRGTAVGEALASGHEAAERIARTLGRR